MRTFERGSTHRSTALAAALAGAAAAGCSIAPKSFLAVNDPAPLVRARAVGMGEGMSDARVIPTLIAKLDDPDGVVRMTAIEELKRRTGQDFGYVPWGGPEDRARSVAAWRGWWQNQSGAMYAGTPPTPRRRLTQAEYRQLRRQGRLLR